MTASEIAKVTGIGTGTVSTLLTKMAKSGELPKADRGYFEEAAVALVGSWRSGHRSWARAAVS
jgi:DNA-binding IclR family transcriptional regulator